MGRVLNALAISHLVVASVAGASTSFESPFLAMEVSGDPESAVTSDLNADGTADIVLVSLWSDAVSVLSGQGDGSFSRIDVSMETGFAGNYGPTGLSQGDINGDGRIDILATSRFVNAVIVFIGNGDGTLAAPTRIPLGGIPGALCVGDFNGDDAQDIAAITGTNTVSVLYGDESHEFGSAIDHVVAEGASDVIAEDVTGDGLQDLVVACTGNGSVALLRNTGAGFDAPTYIASGPATVALAAADMDRDGDADLLTVNRGTPSLAVILSNGNGTFESPATYTVGYYPFEVTSLDINGDGWLEVVVSSPPTATIEVFAGIGGGVLGTRTDYVTSYGPTALPIGDWNEDGHTDLATTTTTSFLNVFLANEEGTLGQGIRATTAREPCAIAGGDLDADGDVDLVTANELASSVSVVRGTGDGHITWSADFECGSYPQAVVLADFTGDGILDAATANYAPGDLVGSVSLLPGSGSGGFLPRTQYSIDGGRPPWGVTIVAMDLNADGRPDLVVPNIQTSCGCPRVSVFLAQASGVFAPPLSYALSGAPKGCAIADVDGDAIPDIVVTSGGSIAVLHGTGLGTFAAAQSFDGGLSPCALTLADVDGDAHVDALVLSDADASLAICHGNPDGSFAAHQSIYGRGLGGPLASMTALDVDEDGTMDVAASSGVTPAGYVTLLHGTGSGEFTVENLYGVGTARGIAAVDMNGDQRTDLVAAASGYAWVLRNRTGAPNVQVASPNGGESLHPGDAATVEWTAGSPIALASFDVLLSLDDGATYSTLAAVDGSLRAYLWTVPQVNVAHARIGIRAHDAAGLSGFDRSDDAFRIEGATSAKGGGGQTAGGDVLLYERGWSHRTVAFDLVLPVRCEVEAEIANASSARVAVLAASTFPAGRHRLTWHGEATARSKAPSGVYWLRVSANGRQLHWRFLLLP